MSGLASAATTNEIPPGLWPFAPPSASSLIWLGLRMRLPAARKRAKNVRDGAGRITERGGSSWKAAAKPCPVSRRAALQASASQDKYQIAVSD
jgi:hypothetical protein